MDEIIATGSEVQQTTERGRLPDIPLEGLAREKELLAPGRMPEELSRLFDQFPNWSPDSGISTEQHEALYQYARQLATYALQNPLNPDASFLNTLVEIGVQEEFGPDWALMDPIRDDVRHGNQEGLKRQIGQARDRESLALFTCWPIQDAESGEQARVAAQIHARVEGEPVVVEVPDSELQYDELKALLKQRGSASWRDNLRVAEGSELAEWLTQYSGTDLNGWINHKATVDKLGFITEAVAEAVAPHGTHLLLPIGKRDPATEAWQSGEFMKLTPEGFSWSGLALQGEKLVSIEVSGKFSARLMKIPY